MKKLILLCTVALAGTFTNGQVSWTTQNSAFSDPSTGISTISIVDNTTAWALGYDGTPSSTANYQTFTRTSNSGASWTSGAIDLFDYDLLVSDISAVSATTAYVTATPSAGGIGGGVWKTTDGGATWAQQFTATFSLTDSFANVVHFFDANNGFCQGDPTGNLFELYTTANGGTTWTKLTSASVAPTQANEYGYVHSKAFAGDNLWFGTNKGRIFKSANKGANWTAVSTPISDFGGANSSGKFTIKDANNAWILASTGVVYKTVNGGTNWTTGSTLTQKSGIAYVPGTVGTLVAVGNGTGSSISYDGGTTWISIESTNSYVSVAALNGATVWAGGFNANVFTDGIYKLSALLATKENQINNFTSIYPNPTPDVLNIKSDEKIKSVSIYDMVGRKMDVRLEGKSVNVKGLENGTYVISIETSTGNSVEKFIKK